MSGPRPRRINLLDIMILVASSAVGFGLSRSMNDPRFTSRLPLWVGRTFPFGLALTLGLFALKFLPPRPSLRRMARQPGFLAGVAVLSHVVLRTIASLIDRWSELRTPRGFVFPFDVWFQSLLISDAGPYYVAPAVAIAWIIGGLQGFRRARPDWVEILLRFAGVLWIVGWGASLARYFF